jgi:signal transduction histidine kinase
MRGIGWPRDTIAFRFGATIVGSMVVTGLLIALFFAFGGDWARPPMDVAARLEGATALIRVLEAAPPSERAALAKAAVTTGYTLDWYASTAPVSVWFDAIADRRGPNVASPELEAFEQGLQRIAVPIPSYDPVTRAADFPLHSDRYPGAYFMGVRLADASWIVFMGFNRDWGLSQSQRLAIWGTFLVLSFVAVSAVATRQLSRPIRRLAKAVRLLGTNPAAPPIAQAGPQELREVIAAFNEMHAQIQEFVAYRTAMLAAISHDLRTPLTRMRLRGEFIDDKVQQARLFRDIDDMQTMIDGALAFFRGDADEETARSFDLPGVLLSIADDFADQGIEVKYTGPDHVAYIGRALALKRAFTNLIENAVKYGTPPEIELVSRDAAILVTVRDRGPGIAADSLEKVFRPFYRLDKSRNRATGGVGLGLTAALAIVRGHGGDITLRNRTGGGLEAVVTLPRIA